MDHPVKASGDLRELRAIHRNLFCDVYDWAGQRRTVDVRKNVEGAEHFLPVSMIERAAGYAAEQLRDDDMLRGLDRDRFVERLAFHYDQVNCVHPFREGNGRTQRVFWSRVARDAGWQVDWRTVHGPTNDAACRAASGRRDVGTLKQMFDRIVTRATPSAGRDDAWRAAELARLSFPTSAARAVESAPTASTSTPNAPRTTPGPRRGRTGPEQGR